ncbi:CoA ester lyase [Subtercola lobariae]|uniref:CoA ester lyase n=2 Tax=Subtercola lobariae TaxID=1588641 RepID=A0A917BI22_9MICO|nr:CoA ester lyase [Subtercola lobariae]
MGPEADSAASLSYLFVPGDRPERFRKAYDTSADRVIIDLEDAVAPGATVSARRNVVAALSGVDRLDGAGTIAAYVRVNGADTKAFADDIEALRAIAIEPRNGLRGIVLAKAECPAAVSRVREAFAAEIAVVPLIESALGLIHALEIAQSVAQTEGIDRLAFGAVDFSLDIGAEPLDENLDYARSQLVIASRVANLAGPLESPSLEIDDTDAVERAARRAKGRGFGGMLAIHPAQLPAIKAGFAPSAGEVDWAKAILKVEGGAGRVDGRLVDRPLFERARRILKDARVWK